MKSRHCVLATAVLSALSGLSATAHAQATSPVPQPPVIVTERRTISTATRQDEDPLRLPFATTIVDRAQMDEVGARSLEDAMRSVPGLQHGTQGNYFTRFETRGLRDTQDVLVLIDGVPLRLLQGNADVTLLAPDLVERIEFIKGPASALYGKNAIGGVAQFFLKPEAAGGRASATAGSFGRIDTMARTRWDFAQGNLFGGIATSRVDGFQEETDRDQDAGVLSFDVQPARGWTTGMQVYASKVRANRGSIIPLANGQPMFGITRRDNYAIPGVYIEGEYATVAWKNRVDLGRGFVVDHLSSYSRYDRLFQGGITIVPPPAAVNKGYSETDTADRGAFHDVAVSHRAKGADWTNVLQLGVNLENGWQDQASPSFTAAPTYRGPAYDAPVTNVNNDPRGIRGTVTTSRFDQRVDSVYLQDRLDHAAIGITAGVRHDRFEQTLARSDTAVVAARSASRTSPRLGFDWLFARAGTGGHAFFANYAEGFRPQSVALNTRGGVIVPALLDPETTRSVEAGIKGRDAAERWAWQASVFRADKIDGQRSFRNGPDTFIFSNATSRVDGIETQVQWRARRAWSGYVHYTYQDARLRDFQTYDNNGNPTANFAGYRVRMSANHIAGAGITWSEGPWSTTVTANYVGSRMLRDNTANPQKLPGYTLLNLAATWRVNAALSLQAGMDNLLDEYYIADDFSAQEAGNAGAPLNAFVRVLYRF